MNSPINEWPLALFGILIIAVALALMHHYVWLAGFGGGLWIVDELLDYTINSTAPLPSDPFHREG